MVDPFTYEDLYEKKDHFDNRFYLYQWEIDEVTNEIEITEYFARKLFKQWEDANGCAHSHRASDNDKKNANQLYDEWLGSHRKVDTLRLELYKFYKMRKAFLSR